MTHTPESIRVVVGGMRLPADSEAVSWRTVTFRTRRAAIAFARFAEDNQATTIRIWDGPELVAEKRPAAA